MERGFREASSSTVCAMAAFLAAYVPGAEQDAAAGRDPGRSARVSLQRTVFARLYRRAPSVESLPWHREQPPALLERAIARRTARGRALDLGCGQGVHAVYLAQQGFSVVGIDFVAAAVAAARTRAEQAGVEGDLLECDVVDYEAPSAFDVVLDSGCLHHVPREKVGAYRIRLDEWLAPGGDRELTISGSVARFWPTVS